MVKFSSILLALTALTVSVFASPINHRNINKVKNDLRQLNHDITKLDAMVTDIGSTMSIPQALVNSISVHRLGTGRSDQGIGSQIYG